MLNLSQYEDDDDDDEEFEFSEEDVRYFAMWCKEFARKLAREIGAMK